MRDIASANRVTPEAQVEFSVNWHGEQQATTTKIVDAVRRAGIDCRSDNNELRFVVPLPTAAIEIEHLAHLPIFKLIELRDLCTQNKRLKEIFCSAIDTVYLTNQRAQPADGFFLPDFMNDYGRSPGARPLGWHLKDSIPQSIRDLNLLLSEFGITKTRVGLEIEFSTCCENKSPPDTLVEVRRARLIDEFTQKHEKREKDGEFLTKLAALEKFNAAELLMYELISVHPKTSPLMMPVFGIQRDGTGYYDAPGTFELRTIPISASEFAYAQHTIYRTLFTLASEYGIAIDLGSINQHFNLSFNTDRGNIFDPDCADYSSFGATALEGIVIALAELPILYQSPDRTVSANMFDRLSIGPSRNPSEAFRLTDGRLEFKINTPYQTDAVALVPLFMAGAALAFRNPSFVSSLLGNERAVVASRPMVATSVKYKTTSHLLDGSIINPDGSITFSSDYLDYNADKIAHELGLIDTLPAGILALLLSSSHTEILEHFFKNTRIVEQDGNPAIQWASDTGNRDRYSWVLEEQGFEGLSIKLATRIRQGETLADIAASDITLAEEIEDLTTRGTQLRTRTSGYINLNTLQKSIKVSSIQPALILKGESAQVGKGANKALMQELILNRIHKSKLFEGILNARFQSQLIDAANLKIWICEQFHESQTLEEGP